MPSLPTTPFGASRTMWEGGESSATVADQPQRPRRGGGEFWRWRERLRCQLLAWGSTRTKSRSRTATLRRDRAGAERRRGDRQVRRAPGAKLKPGRACSRLVRRVDLDSCTEMTAVPGEGLITFMQSRDGQGGWIDAARRLQFPDVRRVSVRPQSCVARDSNSARRTRLSRVSKRT
jgi:hypothetical protein